ncbi:MAG: hypothetical protein PHQ98_03310, partial [Candidatus ainarchaeum sp.]|nr:hypothetical protein [Candidatus ainarchaeum sp.]
MLNFNFKSNLQNPQTVGRGLIVNFCKNFGRCCCGAQGTIEYLVILAVVVVLALVAVVMLLGVFDGGSTSSNSDRIGGVSSDLGVMESLVGVDGNFFVKLKNNSGRSLLVKSIVVDGVDVNYFVGNSLGVSDSGSFVVPSSSECVAGESVVKDVLVSVLVNGVVSVKSLKVSFLCGDYSIDESLLASSVDVNKCHYGDVLYPDMNDCNFVLCASRIECQTP